METGGEVRLGESEKETIRVAGFKDAGVVTLDWIGLVWEGRRGGDPS